MSYLVTRALKFLTARFLLTLNPHNKQRLSSQPQKKKKDYQMALLRTLAELSSPRYDSMRGFSMYSSVHDTVILPSTDHC